MSSKTIPIEVNYTKNKNDTVSFKLKVQPDMIVKDFMKEIELNFNDIKHEKSTIKRNYVLNSNKFRFSYDDGSRLIPLTKTKQNKPVILKDIIKDLKKVTVLKRKKKYVLRLKDSEQKLNISASNHNPMNAAKKLFNRLVDLHNLDESMFKGKKSSQLSKKLTNMKKMKKMFETEYKFSKNNELQFEINEYNKPDNQFLYKGTMNKLENPYSVLRVDKKVLDKKQIVNLREKHSELKSNIHSDQFIKFKSELPSGANLISIKYNNQVKSC